MLLDELSTRQRYADESFLRERVDSIRRRTLEVLSAKTGLPVPIGSPTVEIQSGVIKESDYCRTRWEGGFKPASDGVAAKVSYYHAKYHWDHGFGPRFLPVVAMREFMDDMRIVVSHETGHEFHAHHNPKLFLNLDIPDELGPVEAKEHLHMETLSTLTTLLTYGSRKRIIPRIFEHPGRNLFSYETAVHTAYDLFLNPADIRALFLMSNEDFLKQHRPTIAKWESAFNCYTGRLTRNY